MAWNLDSSRPIYAQIAEQVRLDIVSGLYQPGTKLPSVRELASQAKVNPNTMQKALAELERSGLVYSMRTSGRFITEDEEMIKQLKENLAADQIREFLERMSCMGFQPQDTLQLIERMIKEEEA